MTYRLMFTTPLIPVAALAGVYNSFRKQNNPGTKLTTQQLTNRGLENMQKCFITLLAGVGMGFAGGSGLLIAGIMRSGAPAGVLALSSMTTFAAGIFVAPVYSVFKAGEGVIDLLQSPPTFRSGVNY